MDQSLLWFYPRVQRLEVSIRKGISQIVGTVDDITSDFIYVREVQTQQNQIETLFCLVIFQHEILV